MNTPFYNKLRKVTKLLSATLFLCFFLSILLFSSCIKEHPNDIGLNLIAQDLLHSGFSDTTTLTSHTIKSDSLQLPSAISPVLIGTFNDPVLGITKSSFYGQLTPSNTLPFGVITKQKFDSVVFSIAYKTDSSSHGGIYGAPYDKQLFTVYEVTSPLHIDSAYYSTSSKTLNPVALGSRVIKQTNPFIVNDSFKIKKQKFAPQLRVRLQNLESRFYSDTSKLLTKELFQQYFKGVYVKSDLQDNTGGIYAFDPANSQSKITIYYNDSLTRDFTFFNQVRFNNYKHDYTNAPKVTEQITTDDKIQRSEVYIQGLAGLKTKIYFPGLAHLKNKNIAINKAELVIKVDPSTATAYFPPAPLVAFAKNDAGILYSLYYEFLGQGMGRFNKEKNEYRLNLGVHIQELLKGKIKDNGIELISNTPYILPTQLILGGAGSTGPYKMKLELTYTIL